jgi:hypothetical protein
MIEKLRAIIRSTQGRVAVRFLRTAVAIGLGAALTWGLGHTADLGLDAYWTAAFGAIIAAFGKALRDAGWLPADWSPV